MNRFRFMNVGQGLFYHGKIDDFNFVYDCGTRTINGYRYLNNCIQNEFSNEKEIGVLFVSHLDEDHINGYNELRKAILIKRVILPYLGKNNAFVYTLFHCLCDGDNDLVDVLYSAYKLQDDFYEEVNGLYTGEFCGHQKWIFKCFSKQIQAAVINNICSDVLIEVNKALKTTYTSLSEKIIRDYFDKNGYLTIKGIYKKYFSDLNESCLCLLHYPAGDFSNITLLTGDACFDKGMRKYVNNQLGNNSIKYFQVPHHGAKKNWSRLWTIKKKSINFYLSYGLGNGHNHPSSVVIDDIINKFGMEPNSSFQSVKPYFPWNEYII